MSSAYKLRYGQPSAHVVANPVIIAQKAAADKAARDLVELEKQWEDRIAMYAILKLASQSCTAAAEMVEYARETGDDEDIRAAEAHLAHMQLLHDAMYRRYDSIVHWLGVAATQ